MGVEDTLLLYHERQESSLCGLHSLNTLLQGPVFTEVDLASIAIELDEEEKKMMMQAGIDSLSYNKV